MSQISVLSREFVSVPVSVTVDGVDIDPTGDAVQMAFVVPGTEPQEGDWKVAEWETGDEHRVRILVGPAGTVTLSPGTYTAWLRITDNPERPVFPIDILVVTGTSTPFITSQEVIGYVGAGDQDAGTIAVIQSQIDFYTAELEAILGRGVQLLERTESRVIYYTGSSLESTDSGPYSHVGEWTMQWGGAGLRVAVERGPVASITSIVAGGSTLAPSFYTRTRDGAEVWGGTLVPGTDLVITYVGGHGPPKNLPAKQAVMARAGRWLNKRDDDDVGVDSSAVEGHTVKWMPDAFTDAELRACNRLRAPDMAG